VKLLAALREWWHRDRRPAWARAGYASREEFEAIAAAKQSVWTAHLQQLATWERDPSASSRRSRLTAWRTKWASDAELADRPAPLVAFDAREHPPSYPPTQWITGPSGPTLIPADDKET
jgi:hypothetical protein